MLTFYYASGTCADAVLMNAKALNIELKIINVDISKSIPMTEEGQDFTKINPKGYVPAIALENGEVMTEVTAICAYLSTLKPGNDIFPLQGKTLIDQLQWFNYLATEIHKSYLPIIYRSFGMNVGEEWPAMAEVVLTKRYQYIDNRLATETYLTGSTLTSVDFYCFVTIMWAEKFNYDLSAFKNISRFKDTMRQHAAVAEVYPA